MNLLAVFPETVSCLTETRFLILGTLALIYGLHFLWTNEEKAAFLPLNLTLTSDGSCRWLRRRTIPKNRAYAHNFLAKCGLNLNRPLSIISICKGLLLHDCYWVTGDSDTASFEKINLYDHIMKSWGHPLSMRWMRCWCSMR